MKINSVTLLPLPEVKIVEFQRFGDDRGYFTETYRASDFADIDELHSFQTFEIKQVNESHSQAGVLRGMHFQWNPYMGKLVRTLRGHMIDLVMDIRIGSPHFGKIVGLDMPSQPQDGTDRWIFVPVGFAHGNLYLEETTIEYFCTGEWSPQCETGISPLSDDIDWSLCDASIKNIFDEMKTQVKMSDKDRDGMSLTEWSQDERSQEFLYSELS